MVNLALSLSLTVATTSAMPGRAGEPPEGSKLVTMTLVSETEGLAPGTTQNVGLRFVIAPGWHIYWPGSNDSGFPPSIKIAAPDGFTVAEPQWPAPIRHVAPGDLLDHVLEGDVLVIVPISTPDNAPLGGTVTLTAESGWLVCKSACIPGDGRSTLTLDIRKDPPPSSVRPLFAASRARQAAALPADASVRCEIRNGDFIASGPAGTRLRFFPFEDGAALSDLVTRGESRTNNLSIPLVAPDSDDRVRGVLEVFPASAGPNPSKFYSVDMPVRPDPKPAKPVPPSPPANSPGG